MLSTRTLLALVILGDVVLVLLGAGLLAGIGLLVELAALYLLIKHVYEPWRKRRYGDGSHAAAPEPRADS